MLKGLIAVNSTFVECRNSEGQASVGGCRLHHEAQLLRWMIMCV